MYGLGLSTSEISDYMEEIYGVGISSNKIIYITNKILGEIEYWKRRGQLGNFTDSWTNNPNPTPLNVQM